MKKSISENNVLELELNLVILKLEMKNHTPKSLQIPEIKHESHHVTPPISLFDPMSAPTKEGRLFLFRHTHSVVVSLAITVFSV